MYQKYSLGQNAPKTKNGDIFYSNSTGSSPMDKVQFDLSIGVNPVL